MYPRKKGNKFGAKATIIDGIRFPSKKESIFYLKLRDKQSRGEIKSFLMQIPFLLPGGIKYRLDFMTIDNENKVEFIEVKGFKTKVGELKLRQTEDLYKIKITVV